MAGELSGGLQTENVTTGIPQAVLTPLTSAAIYLVVTVKPGPGYRKIIRSFCADFSSIFRAVEFRDMEARLTCILGVGSAAWDH